LIAGPQFHFIAAEHVERGFRDAGARVLGFVSRLEA
jgi:hypothetical protein